METYRSKDKKPCDNKMDYRGEIGIIVYNSTPYLSSVTYNERIAQAVFNEVVIPEFMVVDTLDDTERAEGGFGSTGES